MDWRLLISLVCGLLVAVGCYYAYPLLKQMGEDDPLAGAVVTPPEFRPSYAVTAVVEISDAYHQYWVIHLSDVVAISRYQGPDPAAHKLSYIHLGQGTGIRIEVSPDEGDEVLVAWCEWSKAMARDEVGDAASTSTERG